MVERDEESTFAGTTTVAKEAPLCGMEVVEVSPPYDSGDITSLLACRSILDVLAVLVAEGKLERRAR
jgi:agmatinase